MSLLIPLAEKAFGSESKLMRSVIDNLPDYIFIKDTQSRIVFSNVAHARVLGHNHPDEVIGKTDFDWFPEDVARQFLADEQAVLTSGQPLNQEETVTDRQTGETRWLQTTKVPLRDEAGNIVGLVGIGRDISKRKRVESELRQAHDELEKRVTQRTAELTGKNAQLETANAALEQQMTERSRTEQALARERLLLRTLIDNLPDAIYAKDSAGRKILANPADLRNMRCKTEAEALGKTDFDLFPPEIASMFYADDLTVIQSGRPVLWREEYLFNEGGQKHWLLTSKLPMRDPEGNIIGLMGIGRDITSLKAAEEKLEVAHRELVEASRQAGMAEVATGVLHNVGNVLNSVNVSAAVVAQGLRESKVAGISRLAKLIIQHRDHLGEFLARDERGRQVPAYLQQLAEHLEQERAALLSEMDGLTKNIEHIKEIVAMQQNYARVGGLVEKVALPNLIEEAISIQAAAFLRHGVTVVREYESTPPVLVDKHKVLQILVNLFSNAKHACDAVDKEKRQVTVRLKNSSNGRLIIQVADNGIGIASEHLTRVFAQGFTTRKGGHGFGLHSAALAAAELGGTLTVHSDGLGCGATFRLEFPGTPPASTPANVPS